MGNVSPETRLVHRQTLPDLSSLTRPANDVPILSVPRPLPNESSPAVHNMSLTSEIARGISPSKMPTMDSAQQILATGIDEFDAAVSTTLAPIATVARPYFHAPSARLVQMKAESTINEGSSLSTIATAVSDDPDPDMSRSVDLQSWNDIPLGQVANAPTAGDPLNHMLLDSLDRSVSGETLVEHSVEAARGDTLPTAR
nr:hypothetical protein CFP56_79460 [Quercus suber]